MKVDLSTEQASVLNQTLPFTGPLNNVDLSLVYDSTDGNIYIVRLCDLYVFDPMNEALTLIGSNVLAESVGDYAITKYLPMQDAIYVLGYRGSAKGNFTLRYDVGPQTV